MTEKSGSIESSNDTIPFPTLTILYLPAEASEVVEEVSQKYYNMTAEDCVGYFHDGIKREYKKITIWSQGIDTLWFNAIIARIKEVAKVEQVPIVSGGIMYTI